MHFRKRAGIIAFLICLVLFSAPTASQADSIRLNWAVDGPVLGGGVVLAGIGEFLLPHLPPPWGPLGVADISQVNLFDRSIMFSYSHPLDLTSTILEFGTAALPLGFALVFDSKDILPLGVVYVESISLALAAKNLLNYLVPRYRPYVYEGGAPGVDPLEDGRSFPSGHTTVVFAAATAGVTLYAIYAPDSPYFIPFTIVSYALAATTASLRVISGMHFTTDVITGAVIGSAFGFFVPFLHERIRSPADSSKEGTGFRMDMGLGGVSVAYAY